MGEILSSAIQVVIDFFVTGEVDRGLRRYRWMRLAAFGVLAIGAGLAAGSLLQALI